jgi:hypothetical protein
LVQLSFVLQQKEKANMSYIVAEDDACDGGMLMIPAGGAAEIVAGRPLPIVAKGTPATTEGGRATEGN